ncbi:MAG: TIGR03560 family F420-dependent LLM class oxidoreductase [Acidimicrobiia bacterium]|nr:TIGR03560 family F420-dependent LLM class oxidoreductase [Acidimicrobiia bacterium]
MDFALMVEPQLGGTYEDLLSLARWAEVSGFVSITRSDHYYSSRQPPPPATDAFATIAGLARETDTIRLCILVTPITFRHPAVVAKMAATIDQMSAGRLDLGVGTGWMDLEHEAFGLPFPPWSERFARLEEALQYLEAALGPGAGRFDGAYYSIDAEAHPKPDRRIPIIIGGSGPKKTPALAGRYADEYNHFLGPIDRMKARREAMRSAARAAGRDPDAIVYSAVSGVIGGLTDADYRERLAAAAVRRDMEPEALEARLEERGTIHGSAEQIAEHVDAIEASGVSKLYLQFFSMPTLEEVAQVWKVVQP